MMLATIAQPIIASGSSSTAASVSTDMRTTAEDVTVRKPARHGTSGSGAGFQIG